MEIGVDGQTSGGDPRTATTFSTHNVDRFENGSNQNENV